MSASDEIQDQIEVIGLPALKSVSESDEFINNIPDGWKPFHKEVYAKALNYAVDGVVLNEIQDGIMKPELEKLFTGQQDIDTTIENIQTEGQLKLDRMQEE